MVAVSSDMLGGPLPHVASDVWLEVVVGTAAARVPCGVRGQTRGAAVVVRSSRAERLGPACRSRQRLRGGVRGRRVTVRGHLARRESVRLRAASLFDRVELGLGGAHTYRHAAGAPGGPRTPEEHCGVGGVDTEVDRADGIDV